MSLIRDILGITPTTNRLSHRLNDNVKKETKSKKNSGVNREVYSLCDNGLPSQSIITNTPLTGNKGSNKRVTPWKMTPFTNPSRSDKLVLYHWCKESEIHQDYPFSAFNFNVILPKYDTHYYNKEIAPLDTTWTKEETDYLWQLCELYDLRFHVIFDRYNPKYDRTIEQLKHRYYSIRKKLVESQYDEKIESNRLGILNAPKFIASIKEEKVRHPLIKFAYSIEKDRERKMALEKQYNITDEMRRKELELIEQIKNNETYLKKSDKRREELKKIKKKFQLPEDQAISLSFTNTFKKPCTVMNSSQIEAVRSSLPKKLLEQVDAKLSHLGATPPIVHTQKVVQKYCQLRTDVTISISLQRKLEKMKKEKEYWQTQLANLQKLYSHTQNTNYQTNTSEAPIISPTSHQSPTVSPSAPTKLPMKRKNQKSNLMAQTKSILNEENLSPKPIKTKANDSLQQPIKTEGVEKIDGRKNKKKKLSGETSTESPDITRINTSQE